MMRGICGALLCLMLVNCGSAQRNNLRSQMTAAVQECKTKFAGTHQAVEKEKCVNAAIVPALSTFRNPDLVQLLMAYRLAIAEQVDAGTLTEAQGNALIAEKKSQIVSEEQQRDLARQAAATQQQLAGVEMMATGLSMMSGGR